MMCRALFVVILLSQVAKPADVQKSIQSQYDAWSKAYMANDVDALLAILSPDYSLRTSTGVEIKRSEYEASLKLRKAANVDTKKYSTKILKLKVLLDGAEVSSRESMISRVRDPKGKPTIVIHEHDYTDTWLLTGGKWLLRRTVTLKERTRTQGMGSEG